MHSTTTPITALSHDDLFIYMLSSLFMSIRILESSNICQVVNNEFDINAVKVVKTTAGDHLYIRWVLIYQRVDRRIPSIIQTSFPDLKDRTIHNPFPINYSSNLSKF